MGFSGDIERFRAKVIARMKRVAAGTVQDMAKEMVMATPTNTGRARGNWIAQLDGAAPRTQTGRLDRAGHETLQAISDVVTGIEPGRTERVWVTNTLSYILDLENGTSDQAPHGMMRLTAQRFPEILRTNINNARG